MANGKATVLLVPGAWHRVDVFDSYRQHLQKDGYSSEAVDLPSIGATPPLHSIDEDVTVVRRALLSLVDQGKDVVLAMHSYGGLVGSEAVEGLGKVERVQQGKNAGVVALFYIAAFMLAPGQSIASFTTALEGGAPSWQRYDVG